MTHPLPPREKVALRPCPFCGEEAVAGSNFDNDHYVMCGADCDKCGGMVGYMKTEMAAIENWNRRTALASGSGDHAELAKLADLLDLYAAAREDEFTVEDVQLIDRGSGLISALLAENAALRSAKWEVQHTDTMNDMVLMGMARDEAEARATEAERKLAEAVEDKDDLKERLSFASQLLRDYVDLTGGGHDVSALSSETRGFLSKEAERVPPAPGAEDE